MRSRSLLVVILVITTVLLSAFILLHISTKDINKNNNSDETETVFELESQENTVKEGQTEELLPVFSYNELSKENINRINGVSWKPEAPVKLEDLRHVKVTYWGFDDKTHIGELVVHKQVAHEVMEIFKELYDAHYPIEKIRLIDEYNADDDLSMDDNNTSSFCFRVVAGSNKLSKHSYGLAIDINPVQNPYVKGNIVSPEKGDEFLDRTNIRKGMILKDDVCYKAFINRGWIWGGEWKTLKDYQHFQKDIDVNND